MTQYGAQLEFLFAAHRIAAHDTSTAHSHPTKKVFAGCTGTHLLLMTRWPCCPYEAYLMSSRIGLPAYTGNVRLCRHVATCRQLPGGQRRREDYLHPSDQCEDDL